MIAYIPFIDPIDQLFDMHKVWYLFIFPLAFLISVGYKAVRVPDMKEYWRAVWVMTVQIVVAMILLGLASFIVIQFAAPLIAPRT